MVTNYSQYDKLRGKEVWAVPICLILGAGLLYWGFKYINKASHYQAPRQEVRAVQSQEYDLNNSKGLERLTTREKPREKLK